MVNIVGDHATYHRPLDAPLTADTEGWARGVSGWVRTAIGRRRPWAATPPRPCRRRSIAPGQIATLILPSDTSWNEGGVVGGGVAGADRRRASPSQIDEAAARPAPRRAGTSCCWAARR